MIKDLSIKEWKCHKELILEFKKGVNFIIGFNGIGKTSILEAIVYGLIGKVRGKKVEELRRVGRVGDTEVILGFSHLEDEYEITRRYNGRPHNHKLIKRYTEEIIEDEEEILKLILDIFDVNLSFLENILYSPEGESYSFLKLDKRNLIDYLEKLVGIGKINEFYRYVIALKNDFEKKKNETKTYIEKLEKIEKPEDLGKEVDLQREKSMVLQNINNIDDEILKKERERSELTNKYEEDYRDHYTFNEKLKKLESKYNQNRDLSLELRISEFNLEEFFLQVEKISELIEQKHNNRKKFRDEISTTQQKIAENNVKTGERKKIRDIMDRLEHNLEEVPEVDCPLCKKPFKKLEFLEVHKDINEELDKLRIEKSRIDEDLKDLRKSEQILRNSEEILKDFLRLIESLRRFDPSKIKEMAEQKSDYEDKKEKNESELSRLKNKRKSYVGQEREIRKKLSEIKASKKVKDALEYEKDYQNNTKGGLICELIEEVMKKILNNQRDFSLNDIKDEIQNIWEIIFPSEKRRLYFTDDYLPYFEKDGENIPYKNASAGEKMILLILIKTVLAKKYTNLPFLFLDEPLEHLNYENRINLIDYLTDICEKGLISQLIITTCEESLTRKFRNSDEVNIISLSEVLKYDYDLSTKVSKKKKTRADVIELDEEKDPYKED